MAIPDIEIKFNKTGFEKEEVMENFNNSKVEYYLWGGPGLIDVTISYKKGMSLSIEGLYNFEITGGYSSHVNNGFEFTLPKVFNNMKIKHLTVNEEKSIMTYEFRKSE